MPVHARERLADPVADGLLLDKLLGLPEEGVAAADRAAYAPSSQALLRAILT